MVYNIMTFGVRSVDADALAAGYQQLNGNLGPNELTAANLINANGIPFQQLLLFLGAVNNGDLNINAGETAFNLSDMGAGGAVVSLGVSNSNDPIRIRANGLTSANTVGDLTANVYFDNAIGFGLANVRDKTAASAWLNAGDSLTFSTMAINGVNQFIASASFVVNVNGGGSEHVVIDFDGNVMRQNGTATTLDGIDLGLIANGATVSLNFAARTISIGATTRAMSDAELSLFQQGGLNQVTIGSLNTSTQGFAIKNLSIMATDTPVSGVVVQAPPTGGETHGTANDDILIGSAVADVLNSGAGDDVVYAGAGDDTINAGYGNDRVDGGDGNDIINTGSGANSVSGGAGNDVVQTQTDAAPDVIDGGSGVDQAIITATGAGDTYVIAPYSSGGVTYAGINAQSTSGVDVSTTNVEEVVLFAGAGADTILIQGDLSTAGVAQNTVIVHGGDGDDVIDASGLVGNPPVDAELYGEGGSDTIIGGGNNDIIDGGAGDDSLNGGEGVDTIYGGDGNDLINLQPSGNVNTGVGEFAFGGAGDDLVRSTSGGDTIDGGDGVDRVTYFFVNGGVNVDLNLQGVAQDTGGGGADTLTGIENVSGSQFNDTLVGDTGDNLFVGNGGDDIIEGRGGNDTLIGDGGVVPTIGNDTLDGGDGVDTVLYWAFENRTEGVIIDLASGFAGAISGGETDTLISIENAEGTNFDDEISGDDNSNLLNGLGGADFIFGAGGADTLQGGDGNDTLIGGSGVDTMFGGAGDDSLIGAGGGQPNSTEYEYMYGGDGDDFMRSGTAGAFIDGGAGFERVSFFLAGAGVTVNLNLQGVAQDTGGGGVDTLIGIEGLSGSNFNDILIGDGGDNLFVGNDGEDVIEGRGGNDTLIGGLGNDTLNGGDGTDTVSYGESGIAASHSAGIFDTFRTEGVNVDLQAGVGGAISGGETDTLISIENVIGTNFDDTITGDANDNVLRGLAGADVISGGGGNDLIYGGTGDDTIDGGAGIDIASYNLVGPDFTPEGVTIDLAITGPQNVGGGHGIDTLVGIEFIEGTAFNDTLYGDNGDNRFSGIGGDDVLDGRGGNDTADYNGSTGAASVSLSIVGPQFVGGAGWDTLINIENLEGSAYDDSLTGNAGVNVLAGALGNDLLFGLDGNDVLNGGLGSDTLDGGAGIDTVNYSRPYFEPRGEGVLVDLQAGIGGSISGGEIDTLISVEIIVGTEFDDSITGSDVANELYGGGGADLINGGGGNDKLDGGDGNDELNAGLGVNQLFGGGGDDVLIAGLNAVNFKAGEVFNGGAGIDTLRADAGVVLPGDFHANYFFSGVLSSIERIDFGDTALGDNLIGIGTYQLGGGIANNAAISGSVNRDTLLIITPGFSGTYSLAGTSFTFEDWTTGNADGGLNDRVVLFAQQVAGAAYTLIGSSRDDVIQGALGNDTLIGGDGNDILGGLGGVDSYFGGAGDDIVAIGRVIPGYTENYALETFDGGSGIDTLVVAGLTADLSNIDIVLTSFEGIQVGGTGTYSVSTNSSAPPLLGGHVTIDQGILSQLPTSLIVAGSDSFPALDGQHLTQQDILTVLMAPGDTINMSTWTFRNWEAQDHVEVVGSTANDTILGSTRNDILSGDGGADNINGGAGNDTIDGGSGDDVLNGGAGVDAVYGGGGNDVINLQPNNNINSGVGEFGYGGDGDDLLLRGLGARWR